jgi:hypothetical protein
VESGYDVEFKNTAFPFLLKALFLKRKSFEHEAEVRAIIPFS